MKKYPNGTTMPNLATQIHSMMLPTPQASDFVNTVRDNDYSLRHLEHNSGWTKKMLPTPLASEGGKMSGSPTENQMSLTKMARQGMLPTPSALDWNSARKPKTFLEAQKRHKLKGVTLQNPLKQMAVNLNPTGSTSQLNPLFVEEMMGFPENWTTSPFLNGEMNP
jgi:hypothetical protein